MPIVEDVHTFRRIVPLTVERAVTGPTQADAPDVDDRGWEPDPAGASYTLADVHGPVVGVTEGTDVRVKLKRVRIKPTADIYLVSKDIATVMISGPAGVGPVPADGIFTLHGVSGGSGDKFAVVEARLGSTTGPLIMEFGVRVFQQIRVGVQPHLVTINGGACATTQADVSRLEREVNAIWRPCGVRFNFQAVGATVVITNFLTKGEITFNDQNASVVLPGGANMPANYFEEFWQLRGRDRADNMINLYFVGNLTDLAVPDVPHHLSAATWDRVNDPQRHGVVMRDGGDGNDLAHEFGHFLGLDHADEEILAHHSRQDMWVCRQLMFSFSPFVPLVKYRGHVGYGNLQRGALITMRNKPQFNRDAEWFDARTRGRNPF